MKSTGFESNQKTRSVLNTAYPAAKSDCYGLAHFFSATDPLGKYSVVEIDQGQHKDLKVIVDHHFLWLDEKIHEYFGANGGRVETGSDANVADDSKADGGANDLPAKLSLRDIKRFVSFISKQNISRFELANILKPRKSSGEKLSGGSAPIRDSQSDAKRNSKYIYIEELIGDRSFKGLFQNLVFQIMVERFTKRKSRLGLVEVTSNGECESHFCVLVKSEKKNSSLIFDAAKALPTKDEIEIEEISSAVNSSEGKRFRLEVLVAGLKVVPSLYGWDEKNKLFSLFASNGRELNFKVIGRSAADRRFKNQEKKFSAAQNKDLVPVEIGFHPFWRTLGHTTVRIGQALYELSSEGWRAHNQAQDTARGFLFGNPFFKKQYRIYGPGGMPPASIGCEILVSKERVERLWIALENLAAAKGRRREKFNLWTNNCNQGIVRVLESAGIEGFTSKGYLGFSSILSFRNLLLSPKEKVEALYLYPLPGIEINAASLRQWVPRLVYRSNSTAREIIRAVPSLLTDWWVVGMTKTSNFIYKRFKIRLSLGVSAHTTVQ